MKIFRKLLVYAPANEQVNVNRTFEELDEIERSVVEILSDEDFVDKLCSLMSIDEKKDETFLTIEFRLFCVSLRIVFLTENFSRFQSQLWKYHGPHVSGVVRIFKCTCSWYELSYRITASL